MQLELGELIRPAVALAQRYAARGHQFVTSEKLAREFVSDADEAIETDKQREDSFGSRRISFNSHDAIIGFELKRAIAD
jgi:hypothetical protein